ncbi:exopolysaccharide biosynthesis protein [Microcoleus sp. FACHB-672]|uniref:exopolysaccharide biosynthesis protein n=1 Tax=Microcoleus sp. FACHB-672 TaxID=2692825 RepID=UPI0016869657|nr:exopolysaccharide biosynthesis protein [Microcoleus sp. FACHB-672]MBD2041742.1 exopolysaccharide biosynthesis protein [Microcoleus sp. FACHB-672]
MPLKFSQDIESLLKRLSEKSITLADIIIETKERGFSLVIGLLALPFLFPMPPGLTAVLGIGSLLLAAQMALGRRTPWLPKKVAQFQFPHAFVLLLLKNLKKITRILEKLTKRRLPRIADNPRVWQINGICIAWLTLLLMLPIPFTNPIPTIGILLFVVATLESDGLLICISYILTLLITFLFAFIIYTLWHTPGFLQNLF